VLRAGTYGNKRQGRPTPTFQKLGGASEFEAFWNKIVKREVNDKTGETEEYIEFDSDQVVALPGEGEFKYAAPGQFAGDTEKLLGLLFYLIIQSSEVPEFVMGNAISSSKASAETQMPVFIQFIQKKRGEAEEWIRELCEIVLAMIGAVDLMARVENFSDDFEIEWEDLTTEDGELTIKAIDFASTKGWITRETGLSRLPGLKIKDVTAELRAADKEQDELRQREEERMKSAVERAIEDAEARAAALDAEDDETDEEQPEEDGERVAA
jgi:hypothetical protein